MLVLPHEDLTPTGPQELKAFVFLDFKTILKEFFIALSKTFIEKPKSCDVMSLRTFLAR